MAYPERPMHLPVRLEMAFGADPAGDPSQWAWTDVTQDVVPQTISISRGRSSESSAPSPSSATLTLDNSHGHYTPGHPLSPHYPYIRQGVPARLWVQSGQRHVLVPDRPGARLASVPLPAPVDGFDVSIEMALDRMPAQLPDTSWSPHQHEWQSVVGQYYQAGDQRSWAVVINSRGSISVRWSADGTNGTLTTVQFLSALPYAPGQRMAIRVRMEPTVEGRFRVTAWHAPRLSGPWRHLGTQDGTEPATIYPATHPIEVGEVTGLQFPRGAGRYYGLEIRRLDGTLITAPDLVGIPEGASQTTDAQGVDWTLQGGTESTTWRRRLVGQVDEWAPTWPYGDLSQGTYQGEARVSVTISGILRRLGAGAAPLQSTLRRLIPTTPQLVAYWPMEDGRDTTAATSGIPEGPTAPTSGLVWGSSTDLVSSAPLPQIGRDGATMRVLLPTLPSTASGWRVEMVYHLDDMPGSQPDLLEMLGLETSGGGIARITGFIGPGPFGSGELRIAAYNDEGEIVGTGRWGDPTAVAAAISGWCRIRIACVPVTGGYEYRIWWTRIGLAENWYTTTPALPYTVPTRFTTRWPAGLSGMPIGHITYVSDHAISVYGDGSGAADDAYRGERALTRMRRLAQEERLPMSVIGDPVDTPPMGPQRIDTLLGLIQECADADGGVLSERVEVLGLQYRPRHLLYNQEARLRLAARRNEIDEPFSPVLDDQLIRNDITMSRVDGSSAQATDPVSIATHGLYSDSATLNVWSDDQLPDIAAWRLHRGTWPGMRYPAVTTALDIAPHTAEAWMDRAEGDRVQVTDLPPQHPPGPVDLMVEGTTETIAPTRWSIEATASPAGPWTVGEVAHEVPGEETGPIHVDTDGSELAAPVGADDTELSVVATVGEPWSTDPSDAPWDITVGGERMTVTAVGEPGGATWDAAGAHHAGQTSTAIVAPSVTGPGLLICAWQGFGQPAGPYTLPAGMTAAPQMVGYYARSAGAWQAIGSGPSGTRTAVITGEPDAWAALSIRADGATVADTWAALGESADATLTTGAAAVGQWLLAVVGWDWDPADAMTAPSGAGWQQIAVSGPPGDTAPRLMAWARPVTDAGPQAITAYSASSITDCHLRVWLLSGIPPANAQPFTVIRSVNGIRKAHPDGADVRLADPMTVAL
ncbi:hypothetical protein MTQ13_03005 [Streptomyces sp. XM4011]|uniref:hypothetical protein n=1 Tax=Streptomyces sp. XM4011 TaxID=2929780 RepID=UPI001FF8C33A|nr:hypothetical protein [Streptomyces sp. XM4011]MCK1813250.1 hypothetical protein [Streptomyces sp. XM4011]